MAVDRMPFGAFLLLFTTLLSSLLFAGSALDIGKKKVVIKKLDMCKGKENVPLQWSNVTINYNDETKEATFELVLTVLQEVGYNFSMSFNFWKCDASGNPDSCEYVIKNYVNKEICKYMVMKNQGYTPFMEHFDKPLVCPIKPGVYRLLKSPINGDFLKLLPIGDAIWKVKLNGFDNDELISCVDLELQITPYLTRRRG